MKNALLSLYGFKRIISKKKYDFLIAYNTEYSLNKFFADYDNKKGIKIMNFAAGKNPYDKYKTILFYEAYKAGLFIMPTYIGQKLKKTNNKNLASVNNYISQ